MSTYDNRDNLVIIDGLLLKIEAQDKYINKLLGESEELAVADYLQRQFIYENRNTLLGDFSEFSAEWAKECANSFGLPSDDVNKYIIRMLNGLADDGFDDFNEVASKRVASAVNKIKDIK